MNDYWISREIKQRDAIFNQTINSYNRELVKQYRRCLEATKRAMADLYDEILIASGNDTLLASDLYKYNRYYKLIQVLNKQLKALGVDEVKLTEKKLLDMYAKTSAAVGKSINFNADFNQKAAHRVIDNVWCADGKHWSDRIWKDKAALQVRLEKGLIDCVSRGTSKDELVKTLMADFDIGFRSADRIARTELSYIQNQATLDKYNEAGVKKYEILAAHDARTCDICSEMNGKIFELSKAQAGVNMPPFHPNCRCAVLGVIDDSLTNKRKLDIIQEEAQKRTNEIKSKDEIHIFKQTTRHLQHAKEITGLDNDKAWKQYEQRASEFIKKDIDGVNIDGFISNEGSKNGWLYKYDKTTNEFAILSAMGTISTYFKPDKGIEYWLSELKKHNIRSKK